MNKFRNLFFVPFLFFLVATIADAQEVYCGDIFSDEGYTFSSTFDTNSTEASCDTWKDEFWQKHQPGAYNNCLNVYAKMKVAYQSGKCSPVIEKEHNFGTTMCKIKLNYENKRMLGKECSGTETDKYMKKLDYMYHDFK